MGAQAPFDKTKARFIIKRIDKDDHSYAGVYFITGDDASTVNIDDPIAITAIDHPEFDNQRHQFEWLVGGAAAFHDVEVHSYLDNPDEPYIKHAPSHWKNLGG